MVKDRPWEAWFVHLDVYGPMLTQSLGGAKYYVTFIDDATRKVWVYAIAQKSDVF